MGPLYCETPPLIASFPVEPINAWSNLFIIALGIAAMILIRRRSSPGFWLLAILLVANGIGSLLWHGFRTPSYLIWDILPAIAFLLTLVYLWARRFYTRFRSLLVLLLFLLFEIGSLALGSAALPNGFFFVPVAPPMVILAAWFIAATYQHSKMATVFGTGSILSALIALLFRSVDTAVCTIFPIGTHFLWHILLSLGAFLGILTLMTLDAARESTFRSKLRIDM